MLKCRIGLVSACLNEPFFLILGELYDHQAKKDTPALYRIYQNTKYLTRFYVKISDNSVTTDNIEDIDCFRDTFKFTRKITVHSDYVPSGVYPCDKPCLCDIDCMTPLFSDKIPDKNIYRNIYMDIPQRFLFVIWPENNPITRGLVLDACVAVCGDTKNSYFYIIGKRHGQNVVSTATLSSRYLISLGVDRKNIFLNKNPDIISEIIRVLKLSETLPINTYLAVSSKNIQRVASLTRNMKNNGILYDRVKFICE